MRLITLVTGGARSGKSRFAEQLALRISEHYSAPGYYIATAEAGDGEMAERIARHRERREQSMAGWQTIEEPYDLTGRLERSPAQCRLNPWCSSIASPCGYPIGCCVRSRMIRKDGSSSK